MPVIGDQVEAFLGKDAVWLEIVEVNAQCGARKIEASSQLPGHMVKHRHKPSHTRSAHEYDAGRAESHADGTAGSSLLRRNAVTSVPACRPRAPTGNIDLPRTLKDGLGRKLVGIEVRRQQLPARRPLASESVVGSGKCKGAGRGFRGTSSRTG